MQKYGNTTIEIISLMLQRTGTFKDVYNRAFTMNIDDDTLSSLRSRLHDAGTEPSITSRMFRGLSSGILVPKTEVDRTRDLIAVPDGWDSPRCRFMMEVRVTSGLGEDSTYYFQGFTEHMGLSNSGNIDDRMMFYINGFIRVQKLERQTRRGTEVVSVVKESAQVIDGQLVFDVDRPVHMLRTVDLYSNMQERFYATAYNGNMRDGRTVLRNTKDAIFNRRKDNLPGEYLSDTLNAYRRNRDTLAFGMDSDDVVARTHQTLSADLNTIRENPVLRHLGLLQGEARSTRFTIRDLLDLDPDVTRSGVISGGALSQKAISQLAHHHDDVSDWRAATLEANWATQISNVVASIMMQHYHQSLTFSIDNMSIDHRVIANVEDSLAIAENMPREIFERMMDQLEEAFEDICGGHHDFTAQITANQFDQTEILLTIDNGNEQRFFVPSFADSLMSPFYSRDKNDLHNMSSDLELVINELSGEITGTAASGLLVANV